MAAGIATFNTEHDGHTKNWQYNEISSAMNRDGLGPWARTRTAPEVPPLSCLAAQRLPLQGGNASE